MTANSPHIVLGVTGSIAAYKAAEIVRIIKKKNWNVSVLMTRAATHFVGELTFRTLSQNPVAIEMFEPAAAWQPAHISLAERADVMAIAPCTANVIAKLACGLADDLLTATVLACAAPLVIAPAMNVKMWEHPATQANVRTLKNRKAAFVDVWEGDLACGCQGKGRMAPPEIVAAAIERALNSTAAQA